MLGLLGFRWTSRRRHMFIWFHLLFPRLIILSLDWRDTVSSQIISLVVRLLIFCIFIIIFSFYTIPLSLLAIIFSFGNIPVHLICTLLFLVEFFTLIVILTIVKLLFFQRFGPLPSKTMSFFLCKVSLLFLFSLFFRNIISSFFISRPIFSSIWAPLLLTLQILLAFSSSLHLFSSLTTLLTDLLFFFSKINSLFFSCFLFSPPGFDFQWRSRYLPYNMLLIQLLICFSDLSRLFPS